MPDDLDMLLGALGPAEPAPEEGLGEDAGLEAGAEELMAAIQGGDKKAVVAAFRAMFEMLESRPHAEYEDE